MATNRLQIRLDAIDNTKRAFSSVKSSIFSLKGLIAGLGVGLAVKSFVSVGRSVEDLQVRLKQLFGSAEEGAKAFDVMSKFASRVPFSLEEIQAASGNLAVVAGNASNLQEILQITGNVAAVTGIDFRTAGEQIQRAFAGGISAADIFREKGVRDMLGFKAGATVSAEETVKAFQKVFGKGGRFGKATDELANTFSGTLSMLGDKLFNFKRGVANAGFFDELKKEFKALNEFMEENSEQLATIGRFIGQTLALAVKTFAAAIQLVVKFTQQLSEGIRELEKFDFTDMGEGLGQISDKTKRVNDEFKNVPENLEPVKDLSSDLNSNLGQTKPLIVRIAEELKNVNDKFKIEKELVNFIQSGVKGVSRSLAESIVLGKNLNESFQKLAQSLLVAIIQKTIERIALLLIEKGIQAFLKKKEEEKKKTIEQQNSALKKQIGLRAVLAAFSGGFGLFGEGGQVKARADGGGVGRGSAYMVGERGRELFIPNQDGEIVSNERLQQLGTNVNFTINATDVKGVKELLIDNRSVIVNIINSALNQKGKAALV